MNRSRRPRSDPKEKEIQKACVQLMELDGWRHLRTDPVSDVSTVRLIVAALLAAEMPGAAAIARRFQRGKGFGEVGMPDSLFLRYSASNRYRPVPEAEVLWCEWKRLDGETSTQQRLWHAAERSKYGEVWVAGENFPPSVAGFWAHYCASALLRNRSLLNAAGSPE